MPQMKGKAKAVSPALPVEATMSIARYAAYRDVQPETIRKWITAGHIIQRSHGRIDVVASDEALAQRSGAGLKAAILADGGSAAKIEGPYRFSTAEAQRRKHNITLAESEMEFRLKAGKLVEVEVAAQVFAEDAKRIRDAFLALPAAVAPRLVNQPNPAEIQFKLYAEVVRILEGLVQDARQALAKLQVENRRRGRGDDDPI